MLDSDDDRAGGFCGDFLACPSSEVGTGPPRALLRVSMGVRSSGRLSPTISVNVPSEGGD